MPVVTIQLRVIVAFATGLAIAAIGVIAFQAWRADAAPGDSDATLVPISPCRLADTRPDSRVGTVGRFSAQDTNVFQAHGTNGNCTIPADAVGLSLNVTALDASQPTFLAIWPDGPRPEASSLNPVPGQPPTPNAVVTNVTAGGAFNIYNLAGGVDVVVDVNGYYTRSSLQELAARLGAAEAAQPFAVTEEEGSGTMPTALTTTPEPVISVSVSAPVAGQVTLGSTAGFSVSPAGADVACAIVESTAVPSNLFFGDVPSAQWFESPGANGNFTSLSGTRTFSIAAGETIDYVLACEENGGSATASARNLTAIFTPAP